MFKKIPFTINISPREYEIKERGEKEREEGKGGGREGGDIYIDIYLDK